MRHAKPICEGVVGNLQQRDNDPSETIQVGIRQYAFGSPEVPGLRYLATTSLGPCVAIIAHNPETRIGFMSHIDTPNAVLPALSKMVLTMEVRTIVLYGGDNVDSTSFQIIEIANKFLKGYDNGLKVTGRDLFRGPNERSQSIAIDTSSGDLFIPDINNLETLNSMIPALFRELRLTADSPLEIAGGESGPRLPPEMIRSLV